MSCGYIDIALALIAKSGVQDWNDPEIRAAIIAAANEIAQGINDMATKFIRVRPAAAKTLRSAGGTAVIAVASVANNAFRQSATIDLGESWAQYWRMDTDYELAATPSAGNAIHHYGSFSNATGAGAANTTGSDGAYTGYSSNAAAGVKQLEYLGAHICTSQATATVQKARPGIFFPKGRYLNLVVENQSGAAFHTSDANCVITLTPLEGVIEDA